MSIVVRAALTAREWRKVRVKAAENGERPSQLIGRAIREHLQKESKR